MAGLEDLYREIILDHYRTPRNRGSLETPPAHMAKGHNPLCGDEIEVYLLLEGEPGSVQGLQMTVADIEATRAELAGRGAEVSDIQDMDWGRFVFFTDPDGNKWALQQLPQRG